MSFRPRRRFQTSSHFFLALSEQASFSCWHIWRTPVLDDLVSLVKAIAGLATLLQARRLRFSNLGPQLRGPCDAAACDRRS